MHLLAMSWWMQKMCLLYPQYFSLKYEIKNTTSSFIFFLCHMLKCFFHFKDINGKTCVSLWSKLFLVSVEDVAYKWFLHVKGV